MLLSEEEQPPKPVQDEAIRNLLHELQIEPLTVEDAETIFSKTGSKEENTTADEVR